MLWTPLYWDYLVKIPRQGHILFCNIHLNAANILDTVVHTIHRYVYIYIITDFSTHIQILRRNPSLSFFHLWSKKVGLRLLFYNNFHHQYKDIVLPRSCFHQLFNDLSWFYGWRHCKWLYWMLNEKMQKLECKKRKWCCTYPMNHHRLTRRRKKNQQDEKH